MRPNPRPSDYLDAVRLLSGRLAIAIYGGDYDQARELATQLRQLAWPAEFTRPAAAPPLARTPRLNLHDIENCVMGHGTVAALGLTPADVDEALRRLRRADATMPMLMERTGLAERVIRRHLDRLGLSRVDSNDVS